MHRRRNISSGTKPRTGKALRLALYEVYGHRCQLCDREIALEEATIEHIFPVSRWPIPLELVEDLTHDIWDDPVPIYNALVCLLPPSPESLRNMTLACRGCNDEKSNCLMVVPDTFTCLLKARLLEKRVIELYGRNRKVGERKNV